MLPARATALALLALALAGCVAQPTPPGPAPDEGVPPAAGFAWRERVTFPDSAFPAQVGTTCTEKGDGDAGCGLDEPSILVDSAGKVYYTAACCIGVTSPVFVSEDGGATFRALQHPTKEGGGEGDLAIDDAGNLYYMDIDLLTYGIARWDASLQAQEYTRRPGELLVDRPWVRAPAEGVVLAIYNTGTDTIAYRSTDAGLTFTPLPVARFGSALAGAYVDGRRDVVGMVGAGSYRESTDGGATWGPLSRVEGCDTPPQAYNNEGAALDEAGTAWHWRNGCVVGRTAPGQWTSASIAFPEGAEVPYSWIAAGAPGGIAIAFYAQFADPADAARMGVAPDAWHAWVAWRADPTGEGPFQVALVDPDPVAVGTRQDLGRRLGDFLQVAIGPDGAIHVAYALNPEMDDSATAAYRRTDPIPALAPGMALTGPFADER
jgi:hypothetical protein